MFASLHNHTYASNIRFIDSINRPKDMVKKAISLGFKGLAITDHESLSCHVELLKIRDNIKEEHPDFKIIFGNEIYLVENVETNDFFHFILLAKDEIGYKQIRQLSSRAWERSFMLKGIRRCPTLYSDLEEIVKANPGHIIASTACLGGELDKAIIKRDSASINKFVAWCISIFGKEDFFLEMQVADSEEQITCNKYIKKIADCFKIDYIITTDSHYLDKEDFNLFTSFLNSRSSSDRETETFYKFTYIMSEDEMKSILIKTGLSAEDIDKGINNTIKISDKIIDFDFRHSTIVPTISIPDFKLEHLLAPWYDTCPAIKEVAYSKSDQNRYMLYLIEQGIKEKHCKITAVEAYRIQEEIDVVLYISEQLKQDISAYLNLVKVIVDLCWKVSVIGVSRGSAGCYFINYLMGITQMNPLDYGIPSFRFLNKARADALPDVDIDIDPTKNDDVIRILKEYFGDDNVINCATFKTEKLKSAVLNSARALNYNNDEAQAIAALVPQKRGVMYSLDECENGNEEKGLEPVPQFIEKLKSYPHLYEMVEKIEGLPTNASIHASALYIFNNGYNANNSLMKAPNGTSITGLNMHDSDDCGALKMDLLKTDAETKIMKAMELLLKDHQIEWKGSLRNTYNAYIHPDVLDYNNKEMWSKAADGKILNLFQMETPVGQAAIKKMRPATVEELATVNGLIRLTGGGEEESPVDRYTRFKKDITLWYREMAGCGLTEEEQKILRKHLDFTYGLCYNQESFMEILMDPQIGGFSLKEADKGRKILSKKKVNEIAGFKEKFLTNTASNHDEFKQYVWDKMIKPQMQYSFNRGHGVGYSLIGVQEMNLATRWNPLYWQCAVLCINSGNSQTDLEENVEDSQDLDDKLSSETEETSEGATTDKKIKHNAPNYVKISTAISNVQQQGINVEVPDINTSEADFIPDTIHNAILYGLKAVVNVNDELYDKIIQNRPYQKVSEFITKVQPTTLQMVSLIKAGCFDRMLNKDRKIIMRMYFQYNALHSIQRKEKITATQIKQAIELKMNLNQFEKQIRVYHFKKYIEQNQNDKINKRYLLQEPECISFFNKYIASDLDITKDYNQLAGGVISVKNTVLNKYFKKVIDEIINYLSSEEGSNKLYEAQLNQFVKDLEEKYGSGSVASWEMATLSYYHKNHELKNINRSKYLIKDFNLLPENSEKNENLCYIAGTIIGTENAKHVVSILTVTGVVNVKFFGDNYIKYNQKLSVIDKIEKDGKTSQKKRVIEDSWFKRGNKILVYGQRRENTFIARNGGRGHLMLYLINGIESNGDLVLQGSRKKGE